MHTEPGLIAHDEPKAAAEAAEIGLFRDVPRWVWAIFISAWATLFGLFVLFFAVDGGSTFAVTIAGLFVLMAFGLPIALAGQSRCGDHDCKGVVQTRSGPLSVGAAATQIVLIPIAAVLGLTALITFAI